jgi:tetratricopeptide (TPR) repeat protein
VRTQPRRAALVVGIALSMPGAGVFAQQARPVPPQRGSPPLQETPYILVTAFRAPTKKLALEGGDELRERFRQEHSAKELFVVTKSTVEATLLASGYPIDSALNQSDLMELARTLRGEFVTDVTVQSTTGKAVRAEARLLRRTGTTTVAQPLPPIDAKDIGDAAKQIERQVTEALKQVPHYNACVTDARAGKYDSAAVKARLGIAAYPNAAWARICLLTAYGSNKSTSPDSIIGVAERILAVDSTSQLALVNLGDAYRAKGDTANMVKTYMRMYALDRTNRALIVGIYNDVGPTQPARVLPILDEALKDNPGDAELLRYKLVLQLGLRQYKNAFVTYDELAKVDTAATSLDMYNRMIGAAQSDSNNAKIIELAQRAAQRFPRDASFPMLVAQTQRRTGQLPQAIVTARRATEIDPRDSRAWLLAVLTALDMKQTDTALAIAKAAAAAGADKVQLEAALLPSIISPLLTKANESKERADWQALLEAAQGLDAALPGSASKFYIAVASFQVGLDALQSANTLGQVTGAQAAASKTKACAEAKLVEELWANATIAMTTQGGGQYNRENAGTVMGAIQQYNEYIPQMISRYCPRPASQRPTRPNRP